MSKLITVVNFLWQMEAQHHQRLAWEDAEQARIARARAEHLAAQRLQAMIDAHPSGELGDAQLNDPHALAQSGLL